MRKNHSKNNKRDKGTILGVCVLSSYPLQTAVQLHGFEEVVLLGPQAAAHVLTDCSDLAAFGLN